MATKNIFDKPFDEGTLDKLTIFEDYFKEWLPVFLAKPDPIWKEIQIFDLFAGEGKDVNGVLGSPMRIISVLNANRDLILKSGVKIKVVVNEYEKQKFDLLVSNLKSIADTSLYELELYNDDFYKIFESYYESMKKTANFLFLDQNGIKQITESVFNKLIQLKQTDFLFFISSSFIKRFNELDEFRKYLKITKQDLEGKSYYHIHKVVLEYYRSMIPKGKDYFLAPFSIKKPAGIYGLIFGTNHTLGIEKFLHVCWKHDRLTGEANFDIDNEGIDLTRPSLFEEFNKPTKRHLFEQKLKSKILEGDLKTGKEVYLWVLNEGFLLKDANPIFRELIQLRKIEIGFKLISAKIHKLLEPSLIKLL
ncbi:three-Cys-motif partner protein TcmP [Lacibacter luteus]|uniref:Three-Cys-motif partner protein TcmP n=1 Tax=Lacibacter luteus TaxID=2508719 RepID=A0A4Q1CID0_9BACT|nr:three-Cys-motif partner protein TcmP [Lacibacter luteus]RXK60350.1 three-Cys-motif partner protein TcmP [Lacibacter luteus]